MRYIPHTPQDIERLLRVVGVESVDALFEMIPAPLRQQGEAGLPEPLSEAELLGHLQQLGARNRAPGADSGLSVFAGAGLYPHAIPSAVDTLSGRSEFYTAYTPYQPEVAQGTLLAIFEYQTMVAELMGMELSNASMYDGASAAAEAVLMARRLTMRPCTLVSAGLHPEYQQTCQTYLSGLAEGGDFDGLLQEVPLDGSGRVDLAALEGALDKSVAAVVIQTPNLYGQLEEIAPVAEVVHAAGALLVVACPEPLALALVQSPGEAGADIAVGEGIGLAGPPNLGGPGVGLLATSGKKAMRALPGRVVGQTVDQQGLPGYVLTLSTREQHIRRERATSNICTNHGLFALRFAIHLALLGKTGFVELARLNLAKALHARKLLTALPGFSLKYEGPTFNELPLVMPGGDAAAVVAAAAAQGVVPGVPLSRLRPDDRETLLVSVNEGHSREQIEQMVRVLARVTSESNEPPKEVQ